MEVAARPTFKGNGMALDKDGNLLVCEQVSSCLVRFRPDGERELVAFHYRGKYLNSPNDVVSAGADGSIYFTDPDYGRWNDWIGQERSNIVVDNGRGIVCAKVHHPPATSYCSMARPAVESRKSRGQCKR